MVYIFPNTIPTDDVLFPLAQIFEQVVFLRPVENDLPTEEDLTPLLRDMVEQKRIDFVCPAPLLDDRDRFLRLIHDIQYRPDDYAGQLSNLSIAGLGGGEKMESEYSIMNTLLRQTRIQTGAKDKADNTPEGGKEQEDKQRSMLLWQARLVLKLGEIVDRKQEEIQQSLTRIALREDALVQELRKVGENGEQPFQRDHTDSAASGGISDSQQRLRLKAWSRLFAVGQEQPQTATFVTQSRDAFELLLEQYNREYAAEPKLLLALPLPAVMTDDNFIEHRSRFQEDAVALISLLREELDDSLFFGEKREDEWAALLEHHYPATENGRCRLSLYFLPEITPQKFFCDTFAHGQGENFFDQAEDRATMGRGVLVGIMEVLAAGSDL